MFLILKLENITKIKAQIKLARVKQTFTFTEFSILIHLITFALGSYIDLLKSR